MQIEYNLLVHLRFIRRKKNLLYSMEHDVAREEYDDDDDALDAAMEKTEAEHGVFSIRFHTESS